MDEEKYFETHWNGFKWVKLDLRLPKDQLPGRLHHSKDIMELNKKIDEEVEVKQPITFSISEIKESLGEN